ncbi:MAG: tRNA (adenosine(37)-N6)-threonylcarbamoyltransferase complex dimerization subunit type 1 TsaB [Bdellovibrionaceae bacterium]|nr:tRNA (adenosine(37)-N6)-threonylcarbamoyltransferase complex dimerization subunit type 1 TsaB [Pseudobdellovibrionaceae bacterium]
MKILSIDTSTTYGSVALLENGDVKYTTSSPEQKSHSEIVHSFIEQGLAELKWKISEIDLFATTIGPGSFTGIRVSINSTKSFSFVFKKPLVGVDSLSNLAQLNIENLKSNTSLKNITCMINAYKNMVYLGQYSWQDNKLFIEKAPTVVRVQDLGSVLSEPTLVVGDGYLTYKEHFSEPVKTFMHRDSQSVDYPTAVMTGRLALQTWTQTKSNSTFEWNFISPLYLRASEAEENKKGIKYTPL